MQCKQAMPKLHLLFETCYPIPVSLIYFGTIVVNGKLFELWTLILKLQLAKIPPTSKLKETQVYIVKLSNTIS